MSYEFSYFRAGDIIKSQPEPKETITLESYVERVKSELYAPMFDYVKSFPYGSANYKAAKKGLPFITPHAVLSRKCTDGVLHRSGLFCFDVDPSDNPAANLETVFSALREMPEVIAAMRSTGGLCFFVPVQADTTGWQRHNEEYEAIKQVFESRLNIRLDSAQKAVSQARYCSYDPQAYYNPNAKPIALKTPEKPAPLTEEHFSGDAALIEDIYQYLNAQGHNITSDYADWIGIGLALAGSLPREQAHSLWHKISSLDDRYSFDQAEEKFASFYNTLKSNYSKRRTIGTIVYLAKKAGYNIPEQFKRGRPDIAAQEVATADDKPFEFVNYKENKEGIRYAAGIDLHRFVAWLSGQGFFKRYEGEEIRYVYISCNIADYVVPAQMIDYVKECQFPEEITQLITKDARLFSDAGLRWLDNAPEIQGKDPEREALFFFSDAVMKATKDGIQGPFSYDSFERVVWRASIIDRKAPPVKNYEIENPFQVFTNLVSGEDTQRQAALITAIGYLLHTSKDETKTKAVFFVDEHSHPGEANGGTGKSLLLKAVSKLRPVWFEDGKAYKPERSSFIWQNVSEDQAVYAVEDVNEAFNFATFFNAVTGPLVIEKKKMQPYQLAFSKSPKIAITTNYLPPIKGSSYKRRMMVYSLANIFSERHTPLDEFGKPFWGKEWTREDWEGFDWFMMNCAVLYLKHGLVKQKETSAYQESAFKAETCEEFAFFSKKFEPNEKYYLREYAGHDGLYDEFITVNEFRHLNIRTFKRWLKLYADRYNLQYSERPVDNRRNSEIIFRP